MKTSAAFLCVSLCIGLCALNFAEAKGYKILSPRRKTPFNVFPRSRMGMVPFVIPVFIPLGHHRNRYRYDSLQCYYCEGQDNDPCVTSPASIYRRITCPRNEFCNVVRRELILQPLNSTEVSHENHTHKGNSTALMTTHSSQPEVKRTTRVLISRGCKSPEFLQSSILTSANDESNNVGGGPIVRIYTQFCLTDMCNHGDGRLKCYECEGTGSEHPCNVNPANVANIVTCKPNHYCNILRTSLTTNSSTSPNETITTITVTRGCKNAAVTDDDYDNDEETNNRMRILTLSCSSDLCNYVDANYLSTISSATGTSLSVAILGFTILLSLTFLLQ